MELQWQKNGFKLAYTRFFFYITQSMKVWNGDIFISVDINKIFNLFDSGSGQDLLSSKNKTSINNTPLFFVGMFRKLILNEKVFQNQIGTFMPTFADIDLLSETIVFYRAQFYIDKVNLEDELCCEALKFFNSEELIVCFKLAIHFWEEKEEYEKCAHLQKLQDFCENSKLSLPS